MTTTPHRLRWPYELHDYDITVQVEYTPLLYLDVDCVRDAIQAQPGDRFDDAVVEVAMEAGLCP